MLDVFTLQLHCTRYTRVKKIRIEQRLNKRLQNKISPVDMANDRFKHLDQFGSAWTCKASLICNNRLVKSSCMKILLNTCLGILYIQLSDVCLCKVRYLGTRLVVFHFKRYFNRRL